MEPQQQVFDVAVVGAGIMGSCSAYFLAKQGLSVVLLEQFDFLHRRGSSHGESRIIRKTYPEDYYTRMMHRAYDLWDEAHVDAGYSVITKTGGLDFGPRANIDLQSVLSNCKSHDVPYEVLSPQEILERYRIRVPEDHLGIFSPDAGVVHATKACAMFQQLAAKFGAVLRDRTEVLDVSPNSHSSLSRETMSLEILTSTGVITCKSCVLAVGAWTKKLVANIAEVSVPVEPLHTTVAYWKAKDGEFFSNQKSKSYPIFINYDEPYVYGMPAVEYPGLIKVSLHGGSWCDPDSRSLCPDVEPLRTVLKSWILDKFHGEVEGEHIMAEACMYSMTPDQDFILDFVPLKTEKEGGAHDGKVLLVSGFSGHGFKLAPLIGKWAKDMVCEGQSSEIPNDVFCRKRFQTSKQGNTKAISPQVKIGK